ncbi:MAG: 3-phosphoshikimate 1-carboxyvinyltransferase [Clostridia bacterium]|nr:3-phosphoshikimate 1-carboxyvinyltransferase [Clostridia bacterium]
MEVYIKPSVAKGKICAPPSKSVSHRALICAALSGESRVDNLIFSDDILATISGLSALGAQIKVGKDNVIISAPVHKTPTAQIDCNESGSALRFLLPLSLVFCESVEFTGSKRLFERDLSVYEEIARNQSILFSKNQNKIALCGKLKSGNFSIRGDISSQFVSGLMFALPLLEGDSFIEFTTEVESGPYIDLTVKILLSFGVVITPNKNGYLIKGGQKYKGENITIEGDYSNAAFLDALNLLGGDVKVEGLLPDTAQGDRIYKDYFNTIRQGGVYDVSSCPDLAPVLFTLAAMFSGACFKGTARLKIKESDRAEAMREELSKLGADILVNENEVIIKKSKLYAPKCPLCSHNDHRIAMALSLILSRYGGRLNGAEAVSKSYPSFFRDIKKLGIEVSINDN